MKKVEAIKLNSANVKYNNAVDTEKAYDIEANVILNNGEVVSFDGGIVKQDDTQKATFSKHGNNQLSVNFNNVADIVEMCAILTGVNTFVDAVNLSVVDEPINI